MNAGWSAERLLSAVVSAQLSEAASRLWLMPARAERLGR
jgi:hypothetical protein